MDHPPYDIAPPSDTLGLKHLREALRDISFPQRTSELREHVGKWRMPIDGAHFATIDEFLDGVPEKTFRTPEDVAESVARAHPELRE